jgi:hypothetical protein
VVALPAHLAQSFEGLVILTAVDIDLHGDHKGVADAKIAAALHRCHTGHLSIAPKAVISSLGMAPKPADLSEFHKRLSFF